MQCQLDDGSRREITWVEFYAQCPVYARERCLGKSKAFLPAITVCRQRLFTPVVTRRPPINPPAGDTTPPTLDSASVSGGGTSVTLVFSENVTATDWDGLFEIAGDILGAVGLAYDGGDGTDTVTFDLASGVLEAGEAVTLSYDGSPAVEDLAGNALENFTDFVVSNPGPGSYFASRYLAPRYFGNNYFG